ncbi:MAG: hypothetical protein IKM54_07620, partial [Butyricicoccus sp.]|nr:hypothetical protein [Butyricicoccus sp.]
MNFYEFLPRLLNMSLTASIVILAVLAVRPLLRRAPHRYLCALWLVPLFRLLCPVSLSAPFSLLSMLRTPVVENRIEYIPPTIVHDAVPRVSLPVQAVSDAVNATLPQGREQLAADPLEAFASLGALLWLTGACVMLIWGAVSLYRVRRTLRSAVKWEENIWHADVSTAFVWGVLRPRIYLPFGLTEQEESLVLAHERMHIRRGDHILRVLMYLALCIHWFNPLVWVMFVLCGRDTELACDAAVLAQAQTDVRADYAQALLRQAGGRALPFSPLSFGAGDVKARIERILRFEGTRARFAAAALLVVATLGLCLLVNPEPEEGKALDRSTATQYVQAAVAYLPANTELTQEEPFRMALGEDDSLFLYSPESGWRYAGRFEEIELTQDELREAFRGGADDPAQWEPVDEETFIRSIRRTWQCRVQTNQTVDYVKNLNDETEEERQLEESVMSVWTLFETANGNRYMAFSALGNWDAQAANYGSFFGADSVEWLGERPPSGWIGDARQPTVFFMFRMEREVWNGYEMAQQE